MSFFILYLCSSIIIKQETMTNDEKYLFLLDEIKEQQKKVDEETSILRALELIARKYEHKTSGEVHQDTEPMPTKYEKGMTLKKKVYIALSMISTGTIHDVAASLMRLEPDFTGGLDKALRDCRTHLSRLNVTGKIKSKKGDIGRQYVYMIQ